MLDNDQDLLGLLISCKKGDHTSQDRLYRQFYGYAMGVCLRYCRSREEAIEVVNDGFLKVFTKLEKCQHVDLFKGWLRKIMIHCAINHYRRHEKHYDQVDISYARYETVSTSALDRLSEQEILLAVQQLPASYRMVFNLHTIEGYKHHEIARRLGITVGTSKSALAMARSKLKKALIGHPSVSTKRFGHG